MQKELVRAVKAGDVPAVKRLLSLGASPNRVYSHWWRRLIFFSDTVTPLLVAVRQNSDEIVELLLSAGADPDQHGEEGSTPLTRACLKGSVELVHRLLTAGANVNLPNRTGPPLFHATVAARENIVELLLNHGADPNAVLQQPLRYFTVPPSILRMLIDFGGEAPPEILEFLDNV